MSITGYGMAGNAENAGKSKGRVLVAGFATRHVATSAHNAGYEVHSVDSFCDLDLAAVTESRTRFTELSELQGAVEDVCRRMHFDIIAATSCAESLDLSSVGQKICGSDPKVAAYFLDKKNIQDFFEKNGIPCPKILPKGVCPAMIKPCSGAGGWRNKRAENARDEEEWCSLWENEPYIRQELVEGVPCSVSCISDGKKAVAVSFNEQLLRGGSGERAYGFSGAVTPFKHPLESEIVRCAERAVALSGCVGSVGVDFVAAADRFWAIEINPRFQATMDVVEKACGINLFQAHVDASRGILPHAYTGEYRQYAARKVIFADRDMTVKDDLLKCGDVAAGIADIPAPGTVIEEGGAVLSVYGEGASRAEALESLDKTIRKVNRYICRW